MKTPLTPTADRVLLSRLAPEVKTGGSIIIPESAQEQNQQFRVVAVGPGKVVNGSRVPMDVKVGDVVLLGRYAGSEITVAGVPVFLASQDEILAVVG